LNEEVSYTTDKSETIMEETANRRTLRSQVDKSWYNPGAMCSCFMKFYVTEGANQLMERKLQAVFGMAFITAVTSIITHTLQQHGKFSLLLDFSSVGMATRLRAEQPRNWCLISGWEFVARRQCPGRHCSTSSIVSNGYSGVQRPRCEPDHSSATSDGIKNAWSYTSTSLYVFILCQLLH
jgi:hypothetical protein